MLDSGQSEVFVSNVSGHSQPPSAGPPVLSESWPFFMEGILRPGRARISLPGTTHQGPGPSSRPEGRSKAEQEILNLLLVSL